MPHAVLRMSCVRTDIMRGPVRRFYCGVQDAVDEGLGVVVPEVLGQLDGLVHGHLEGDVGAEEHLEEGEPQDGQLGDAVQPALGVAGDDLVDLRTVVEDPFHQGPGVGPLAFDVELLFGPEVVEGAGELVFMAAVKFMNR
ncbi:hypothetical protein MASR2M17_23520 [Aminivibrio sp.]